MALWAPQKRCTYEALTGPLDVLQEVLKAAAEGFESNAQRPLGMLLLLAVACFKGAEKAQKSPRRCSILLNLLNMLQNVSLEVVHPSRRTSRSETIGTACNGNGPPALTADHKCHPATYKVHKSDRLSARLQGKKVADVASHSCLKSEDLEADSNIMPKACCSHAPT